MKVMILPTAVALVSTAVIPTGAADVTAVPVTPFSPASLWRAQGEGASLLRAGLLNGRIVLEGAGTSVNPAAPSRVTVRQRTRFFQRAIQTKLEAFSAPNAGAEAGIGLEAGAGFGVGMRLAVTPGGSLRMEGRTFSSGGATVSGGPVTGLSFPLWLRVTYLGGGTVAHYSQNGTNWTQVGSSMPLTFPDGDALLFCTSGSAVANGCALFSSTAISGGDADENGIFDGYEMQQFGRLLGAEGESDADGDGRSLAVEWQQGTNPAVGDAPPYLEFQPTGRGQLQLVGRNLSRSARLYSSLDLQNWTSTGLSATNGAALSVTLPSAALTFWRGDLLPTSDPLF